MAGWIGFAEFLAASYCCLKYLCCYYYYYYYYVPYSALVAARTGRC